MGGLGCVWRFPLAVCVFLVLSTAVYAQPPVPALPMLEDADELSKEDKEAIEKVVAAYLKKRDEEKKKADEAKKKEDEAKKKRDDEEKKLKAEYEKKANDHGVQFCETELIPSAHQPLSEEYESFLQSLYDSLSAQKEEKKWYEKLSIRGYTQIRFGRTLETETDVDPNLFGDRTINGNRENFLIRRMRLILSGDVTDHLSVYIQPDFASNTDGATNNTFFAQLRDAYADIYIDEDRVNRVRVGLSKVPYGFENLQSSSNRGPLDRTDAINSAVAPNERDLGVFYYFTPIEHQKIFSTLVASGLKGSGNYGTFAFGAYNGQGGSQFERNLDMHIVSRFTYPFYIERQFFEASIQGYRGEYVVGGSAIRPLGIGPAFTPLGTGGNNGHREQRVAGTFVVYPQPIGFQAEWQVGEGPALAPDQRSVDTRHLYGGYVMAMYRHETCRWGIFTPFVRYQQYNGGYRNISNAPFGHQRSWDIGIEWQMRKELELVLEYGLINTPNFTANNTAGQTSYRDFEGSTLRLQCQFNY